MKKGVVILLTLFVSSAAFGIADDKEPATARCKDEATMVSDYEKGLSDLVGTVKKEKLEEFRRAYHRRACLSKLGICEGVFDTATSCYDEALKDSDLPKGDTEIYKARREACVKTKEKLIQFREALKAKEESQEAKTLIETFQVEN